MGRVFIIRPFGVKNGIDFNHIEEELFAPALDAVGTTGRTTGDIVAQGNIRTDMFQRLAIADLVLADISIHNANVYYELGIRHGLRKQRTVLVRSSASEVPFDLRTDRYMIYDAQDPGRDVDRLVAVLRATLDSDTVDSPVFAQLPRLAAPPIRDLVVLPEDFQEAVEAARVAHSVGDLTLMAQEVDELGFDWAPGGSRLIAEALFRIGAYQAAVKSWESLKGRPDDSIVANLRLATCYQKLGKIDESDIAVGRVLKQDSISPADRAEALGLKGSNLKTRWLGDWTGGNETSLRRRAALESPYLQSAYEAYWGGFQQDLNAYFPGFNALALASMEGALATELPEIWSARFASDEKGREALQESQQKLAKIRHTVRASVEASLERSPGDRWAHMTCADLACLESDRPAYVASLYRDALAGADTQALDSVKRQLDLYLKLDVFTANAEAALLVVQARRAVATKVGTATPPPDAELERVIVFTGHRIDAAGRPEPRFPAASEASAREKLLQAIRQELPDTPGSALAISGAASGGDILFQEVCAELGTARRIQLALPAREYVAASVTDGGPDWVTRFWDLQDKTPVSVLGTDDRLPRWLRQASKADDYSIWQRNNLWMLHHAMVYGPRCVTFLCLWDGKGGDGPGGTADMVRVIEASGARTVIVDANELSGSG